MHWRNSKVQVLYFIVGKTHTPDEAYRVLKELREERSTALKSACASSLRDRAKVIRATAVLAHAENDEAGRLEAQADLEELNAFKEQGQACIDEAVREVAFIDLLLTRIEPHRVYSHLKDYEANQACQQEEWARELMFRASNFIVSQGVLPPDQIAVMRLHPEWETKLCPHINALMAARISGKALVMDLHKPIQVLLGLDTDLGGLGGLIDLSVSNADTTV